MTWNPTFVVSWNGENWMQRVERRPAGHAEPEHVGIEGERGAELDGVRGEREVALERDGQCRTGVDAERQAAQRREPGRRVEAGWNPPSDIRNDRESEKLARSAMSPARAKPMTWESWRLASIDNVPAPKSITPATSSRMATSSRSSVGSTAVTEPITANTDRGRHLDHDAELGFDDGAACPIRS